MGCKFTTTTAEETNKIKSDYLSQEVNDLDELKEFIGMRDVYRNYEVIENANSLSAGIFPPLWLAYSQKWWLLFLFTAIMAVSLSVNIYVFFLGWLLTSIYCYKAQLNLLFSFSMLEGKVFCVKLLSKSIDEAQKWFASLENTFSDKEIKISQHILKEINERLNFLLNVGLNYLTLSRESGTLSGGEAQRIRLASQIGSGLTGVLYVLDEPSIGLHQKDCLLYTSDAADE